jgi:hypothetical protein
LVLALSSKANKVTSETDGFGEHERSSDRTVVSSHDCQWGINSLMVIEDHGCYICELEYHRLGVS